MRQLDWLVEADIYKLQAAMESGRTTSVDIVNLHGIPILLKDNIDTYDKMHTSAGSIGIDRGRK
jgi:amidase